MSQQAQIDFSDLPSNREELLLKEKFEFLLKHNYPVKADHVPARIRGMIDLELEEFTSREWEGGQFIQVPCLRIANQDVTN